MTGFSLSLTLAVASLSCVRTTSLSVTCLLLLPTYLFPAAGSSPSIGTALEPGRIAIPRESSRLESLSTEYWTAIRVETRFCTRCTRRTEPYNGPGRADARQSTWLGDAG